MKTTQSLVYTHVKYSENQKGRINVLNKSKTGSKEYNHSGVAAHPIIFLSSVRAAGAFRNMPLSSTLNHRSSVSCVNHSVVGE